MHPAIPIGATTVKTTSSAKTQGTVGKGEAEVPFVESLAASLGVVMVPIQSTPKQEVAGNVNVAQQMQSVEVVMPGQEITEKPRVVPVGVGPGKAVTGLVKASGDSKAKASDFSSKIVANDAPVPAQSQAPCIAEAVAAIPGPVISDPHAAQPVTVDVPVAPVDSMNKTRNQAAAPILAKGHKVEAKKVESATPAAGADEVPSAGIVAVVEPVARHEAGHGTIASGAVGVSVASAPTGSNHAPTPPSSASNEKHVEVSSTRPLVDTAPQNTDLRTMTATPNVLEIGLESGSHGWLRVRAELGPAGEVAASVVASSTSAAEGLHKELPAISAYLAEERVGVGSLVVNATEKGAAAQDSMLSGGSGAAGGSQPGQNQRGRESNFPVPDGRRGSALLDSDFSVSVGPMAIGQPWMARGNGSGGWVNVRV